eukprot:CAMPEP_0194551764 /NCGR_PEP_ID=MMETSP0253-20130528/96381_1 /TAXON_ID=2966 /ORGANISM="Noctiluca scintillans" /LENGTH=942 /DNA_ID=CAMNT_0039399225 /DNA_START=29 /DNA_END=2859 /DNA_ORIENTATION=+
MAGDEATSLGDALVAHIDALFDPADEDGREAKQQLLNAAMKFKAVQKHEIQARDDPKAGYLVAKELDCYCHSEQLDLGLYSEEHITQLTSRDPCTQADAFGQKACAKQDEVEVSRLETIEFLMDRKRLADEQQLPRAVELFSEEQETLAAALGDSAVAHIDALFDPTDDDGWAARKQLVTAAVKFKAIQKQEIQARADPNAGYLVAKELDGYCHSGPMDLDLYSEDHVTQLTSRDPCAQADAFGQIACAKQGEFEVSRLETTEFMMDRKRLADEQQLPRAVELLREEQETLAAIADTEMNKQGEFEVSRLETTEFMMDRKRLADEQQLPRAVELLREEQETLAAHCRHRNELCALATDPDVDTDDREALRRTGELKQVFLRTGDIGSLREILDEVEVISSDVVINDVSLSRGMLLSAAQALLPGNSDFPVRKVLVLSKNTVLDETLLSKGMELLDSKVVLAVGDECAPRTFDLVTDQIPEGAWVLVTFRKWYDSTQLHQPSVDAEFEALGVQVSENRRLGVEYFACKTSESLTLLRGKESAVREKASCLQERREEFAKQTRDVEAEVRQPSVDAEFEALGVQVSEHRRLGVEYFACKTSESLAGFQGKVSAVREKASCLQERREEFAKQTRDVEAEVRRLQEELCGIDATDERICADVKKLTQQCDDQMTDAHIEVLQASSRAQELLTNYLAAFDVFLSKRALHQRLYCLHNRLQKRSDDLDEQRQKLGKCIETAKKNCETLLCSSQKADKEVGETEQKFVTGMLADADSVAVTQRQSIQLCDGLVSRSITERDDDSTELVRLCQKLEADIEREKAQSKRMGVLRRMQGDLKALNRRAKVKTQQMTLVRSIRVRMEEHIGTLSSADSHDPWDVVPLLNELFPVFSKSAPVVETTIATVGSMDLASLVRQEVQKALREKEQEAEEAYDSLDGWVPVECHGERV